MTEVEDFIISLEYDLLEADEVCFSNAKSNPQVGKDWEKVCLDGFKDRIKNYLRNVQHCRCAYCRQIIREGIASSEIEHIVDKGKHPQWMFIPRNLTLSCKSCNTKKSTKNVLVDPKTEILPNVSDGYLIVHPYYDRYSENIEILDDLLYQGKTDKGLATIGMCKLNRMELICDRAENIILRNGDDYLKILLLSITPEKKAIIEDYDELIQKLKMTHPEFSDFLS